MDSSLVLNEIFQMNKFVLCVLIVPYTMLAVLPLLQPSKPSSFCSQKPGKANIKTMLTQIPDLRVLAATSGEQAIPPPEQIEEERIVEDGQVALAGEWLKDQDPRQRVIGAEQLSAYPTTKAGDYLLDALKNDTSAEVRSAAAESLGFFESAEKNILDSLISALSDSDATVRSNAFSSLQMLLNRSVDNQMIQKRIETQLKELLDTRDLPGEMLDAIQIYLDDNTASLE
ncbi:MAG: hypothetical protein CVV06_17635 [Gammaproteobacteria bacterium HGW-Gammaproteobacteria-10]|nr:MAG: hypothetical protein CVV06_17635 [Gammaproteobacteria bacterium HGW-Gammaproteobacteria-10]